MTWIPRGNDIVLTLQGGLGNQLFEWAFAHALAAEGRTVVFDRVRLRGERPYALGGLIRPDEFLARPTGLILALATRRKMLTDTSTLRFVPQVHSGFDRTVRERLSGRSYLQGYFQSPRYFDAVADDVRVRVSAHLAGMLTPSGADLAEELRRDPTSVAVHVRRGDYLTNPDATAKHGVLDQKYYDEALALTDELGHSRRIWFSDDPEWVAAHLARPGDTVCPPEATTDDGGQIALMSACAARITANSSFSWWGGWLGEPSTPQHPVIAPRSWFADQHSDASDLIPEGWLRL
ncbi:alpha-1,2-fucosyltransferase [Microbacterium sp. 179-I 3D3 NHS]|uniref:alpha-1,2-fucosyltransferase n=1 Tax=Microbacterium sp. 179-I 3D3 NHS TaxID=3142382 RepID=UPI0039A0AF6B